MRATWSPLQRPQQPETRKQLEGAAGLWGLGPQGSSMASDWLLNSSTEKDLLLLTAPGLSSHHTFPLARRMQVLRMNKILCLGLCPDRKEDA